MGIWIFHARIKYAGMSITKYTAENQRYVYLRNCNEMYVRMRTILKYIDISPNWAQLLIVSEQKLFIDYISEI